MASVRERYDYYPKPEVHREMPGQIGNGVIPPGVFAPKQSNQKYVFSSMISGHDDEALDRQLPKDAIKEADVLFRHVRQFLENAGAKTEDVVSLTVFLMNEDHRGMMEDRIAALFPDAGNRPPYHVLNVAPKGLRGERFEVVATARVSR